MGPIKTYLSLIIGVLVFCSLVINIISWSNKKVSNKAARYILNLIALILLLGLFLYLYGDAARLVLHRF